MSINRGQDQKENTQVKTRAKHSLEKWTGQLRSEDTREYKLQYDQVHAYKYEGRTLRKWENHKRVGQLRVIRSNTGKDMRPDQDGQKRQCREGG